MKKAFIILLALMLIGGGTGFYYYEKNKREAAQERHLRDSLRHARKIENARIAAMEKAHRDSLAAYERTHSPAVIRAVAEKLVDEEMMGGRNHVGGRNWSRRINILREMCDNVLAYGSHRADTAFRQFSFRGLMRMGPRMHIHSDSITRVYYISQESAWFDAHFDIGENVPEGQNVSFKLVYENNKWLLDDFTFQHNDNKPVTVSEEMEWFITEYGKTKNTDTKSDESPKKE